MNKGKARGEKPEEKIERGKAREKSREEKRRGKARAEIERGKARGTTMEQLAEKAIETLKRGRNETKRGGTWYALPG
jgi:hypothetical protein